MQGTDESQNKDDGDYTENKPSSVPYIDDKVLKIMTKMGYQNGLGLGKNKQGITDPVSLLANPGKCGLGHQLKQTAFTESTDFQDEEIVIEQKVVWLESIDDESDGYLTNENALCRFIVKGPRKTNTEDEVYFCDPKIVHGLLKAKGIFEELDLTSLNKARLRANPFESIRSVFFMNRAALKMANIDAATDFMFTSVDSNLKHLRTSGPYYFADVCAGPGGFSEYVLWKKKWLFKGFGLTLKNDNDFKLYKSCCASPVTFQGFYGTANDGNVCNPANIGDFKEKVLHETEGKGVHFMMSDGGFSVEGNENLQEVLSKQIYISQCLVALEVVRTHGHFVTKLFDVFTLFSAGLMFLMSKCFEKVSILKPNASRPANSERYFICCGLKNSKVTETVRQHIKRIIQELWNLKDSNTDVIEIVPLDLIQKDKRFFEYLKTSNERIGEKQIKALHKLAHFCKNPSVYDPRQDEIRTKCLQYWKIPDKPKMSLIHTTPDDILLNYIKNPEYLLAAAKQVAKLSDLKILTNVNDWHFCFLTSDDDYNACHLYIGSGNSKSYKLDSNKYTKVKKLRLIPGTILFGELVREKVESTIENQIECYSLHVIDALRLGEFNVADLPFSERLRLIQTYCEAINHESRSKTIRIRSKPIYPLVKFSSKLPTTSEDKTFMYILEPLGLKSHRESYCVNSILLLKSDENQSFRTTYVLRTQIPLKQQCEEESASSIVFEDFCDYLRTFTC